MSDSPIQTVVVDGLGLAQEMRGQMAEQITQLVEAGQRPPCLAVVRVGEDPIEQHRLDLALETEAIKRLNTAIALCRDKGDNGTREMLEEILKGEEEAADWLEGQLHIVEEIGKEQYLAEQIHD